MRAPLLATLFAGLLLAGAPAPAMLAVGDIAIVGASSSSPNDEVAFVALAAIPAGTTVSFTNSSWQGLTGGAFRANEHFNQNPTGLVWTAPTGGVPIGTLVTLINEPFGNVSTSAGQLSGAPMALKPDGDQVFAFTGLPSAPSFLTGVQFATRKEESFGIRTTGESTDFNQTNLPPGLSLGSTMLALDFGYVAGSASAKDNVKYSGPTEFSGATLAEAVLSAKTAIAAPTNWSSSDTAYTTFTPSFTFTVAAIPEPTAPLLGALVTSGLTLALGRRATRQGVAKNSSLHDGERG